MILIWLTPSQPPCNSRRQNSKQLTAGTFTSFKSPGQLRLAARVFLLAKHRFERDGGHLEPISQKLTDGVHVHLDFLASKSVGLFQPNDVHPHSSLRQSEGRRCQSEHLHQKAGRCHLFQNLTGRNVNQIREAETTTSHGPWP